MTYYPDMSPYEFWKNSSGNTPPDGEYREDRLNVGWLDRDHDFPRGESDPEFRDALEYASKFAGVNATRGLHRCPFCEGLVVNATDRQGCTFALGGSEFYIELNDGPAFASPTLILHYVLHHDYLPPEEFQKALIEYAESRDLNWRSDNLSLKYDYSPW